MQTRRRKAVWCWWWWWCCVLDGPKTPNIVRRRRGLFVGRSFTSLRRLLFLRTAQLLATCVVSWNRAILYHTVFHLTHARGSLAWWLWLVFSRLARCADGAAKHYFNKNRRIVFSESCTIKHGALIARLVNDRRSSELTHSCGLFEFMIHLAVGCVQLSYISGVYTLRLRHHENAHYQKGNLAHHTHYITRVDTGQPSAEPEHIIACAMAKNTRDAHASQTRVL